MNIKHNAKLYSLIFLLSFIAAQFSVVLHNVEHGILEHSHAGQQCEQCLFAKHLDADTPDFASVNTSFSTHKVFTTSQREFSTENLLIKLAREPPSYS